MNQCKDIDINIDKNKHVYNDINKITNKEFNERVKKSNIYMEKQLHIFFGSGRPIYNISLDTIHIRKHNNPSSYTL
tara:strand:- start:186 stop:413 length:228 start_codon:yes stop_codon:yes gene_type:complete